MDKRRRFLILTPARNPLEPDTTDGQPTDEGATLKCSYSIITLVFLAALLAGCDSNLPQAALKAPACFWAPLDVMWNVRYRSCPMEEAKEEADKAGVLGWEYPAGTIVDVMGYYIGNPANEDRISTPKNHPNDLIFIEVELNGERPPNKLPVWASAEARHHGWDTITADNPAPGATGVVLCSDPEDNCNQSLDWLPAPH